MLVYRFKNSEVKGIVHGHKSNRYLCGRLPQVEIINPGYDSSQNHLLELTVAVSDQELAYTLYDRKAGIFQLLKALPIFTPDDFKQVVNYELNGTYQQVRVLVVNTTATCYPSVMLDRSVLRETYAFSQSINHLDEQVHTDPLPRHGADNLYKVSNLLRELLGAYFPRYKLMHYTTPVIEGFSLPAEPVQRLGMFVHEGFVQFLYMHGQRLLYANAFEVETHEDYLYYLLACTQQLDLNPQSIPVQVYGNCSRFSELIELLNRYFVQVSLGQRPDTIQLSTAFDHLPPHLYFHLFAAPLCE